MKGLEWSFEVLAGVGPYHGNPGGARLLVFSGRLAQLVRALARQARGHWFESSIAHLFSLPPGAAEVLPLGVSRRPSSL